MTSKSPTTSCSTHQSAWLSMLRLEWPRGQVHHPWHPAILPSWHPGTLFEDGPVGSGRTQSGPGVEEHGDGPKIKGQGSKGSSNAARGSRGAEE